MRGLVLTVATATPPATTLREDTTALVKKDTLEIVELLVSLWLHVFALF